MTREEHQTAPAQRYQYDCKARTGWQQSAGAVGHLQKLVADFGFDFFAGWNHIGNRLRHARGEGSLEVRGPCSQQTPDAIKGKGGAMRDRTEEKNEKSRCWGGIRKQTVLGTHTLVSCLRRATLVGWS